MTYTVTCTNANSDIRIPTEQGFIERHDICHWSVSFFCFHVCVKCHPSFLWNKDLKRVDLSQSIVGRSLSYTIHDTLYLKTVYRCRGGAVVSVCVIGKRVTIHSSHFLKKKQSIIHRNLDHPHAAHFSNPSHHLWYNLMYQRFKPCRWRLSLESRKSFLRSCCVCAFWEQQEQEQQQQQQHSGAVWHNDTAECD